MKIANMFNLNDYIGYYDRSGSQDPDALPARNSQNSPEQQNRTFKKITLFAWQADSRLEQASTTNLRVMRSMIVIAVIIGVLLVAMQEFLLILAIASLVFVKYLISSTPVQKVAHEITNLGVMNAGAFYAWEDLKQFFFTKTDEGINMLCVDTKSSFPGRLFFIVSNEDKDKIQDLINEYLPFLQQAPKDFVSTAYTAMMDKFVVKE